MTTGNVDVRLRYARSAGHRASRGGPHKPDAGRARALEARVGRLGFGRGVYGASFRGTWTADLLR